MIILRRSLQCRFIRGNTMTSSFSEDNYSVMLKPSSSQIFGPVDIPRHLQTHPVKNMCCNTLKPKCAAYLICIGALHEITLGTIIVFASTYGEKENWWQSAQWLVILICRLLQYPSCLISFFGIRDNNPALIVPFMLSQVSLGSYADLHTYIQLVSKCSSISLSPILIIVLPILIYATFLILFIYNMYIILKSITVSRSPSDRNDMSDLFL